MARPDWGEHPELDMPETVELNLTSLVDVVLVLLIIFMVSTAVVAEKGKSENAAGVVDLQLPTGKVPTEAQPKGEVVVQINADGALFQNGTATDSKALEKDLVERLAKEPDLQVRVDADQKLSYQKLAEILSDLQSLGVHNVSLGMGAK
jgi:biopolymer transport protein ExbD